jgi:hypothetical protein
MPVSKLDFTEEEWKGRKREQNRKAQLKRRHNALEKHREIDRIRNQTPSISRRYGAMKGAAKTRGLPFSITKDEYAALILEPCYYCKYRLGQPASKLGGLDRLDNSKGYTIDNVVSCCMVCNFLRGAHLTPEETKIAVQAVLFHREDTTVLCSTIEYKPPENEVIKWKQEFEERLLNAVSTIHDPKQKQSRTPQWRYTNAKSDAKRRGRPFTLTLEEYTELIQHACFYCQFRLGVPVQKGIGLDRIDNSKGYEPGNVLPCCRICNTIKGFKLNVHEAKMAIEAVINYRNKAKQVA